MSFPSPVKPPSRIEPTGFLSGIQFRPILVGVIVDTIATMALTTGYYAFFVAKELSEQGGAEEAYAQYWTSSEGLLASLVLGSLGTLIGGFYAAYKAGSLEMKHGALVGIGSILLGLVLQGSGSDENVLPEWFMTGNVGVHRKISRHDVIEDLQPTFDIGIKNSGGFALSGMDFGVEQIAH